jgi:hypothetical protein
MPFHHLSLQFRFHLVLRSISQVSLSSASYLLFSRFVLLGKE